jgi:hypothetical protein
VLHDRLWHNSDLPTSRADVRFRTNSGRDLLKLSSSHFDPERTPSRVDRCLLIEHDRAYRGIAVTVRFLGPSVVADIRPAPTPPGPNTLVTAVVVGVGEGRESDKPFVEEPVVSEDKSMPEGKSIGMKSPGMDPSETSEVAGMSDSGTTKTTHATKSAVAHATVTHAPTHPGRRFKRRTGDDGRCRGRRDHHLVHH